MYRLVILDEVSSQTQTISGQTVQTEVHKYAETKQKHNTWWTESQEAFKGL